jgi:glucose-6-phosphate isomerase
MERQVASATVKKIWAKQPEAWKADEACAQIIRNRLGWVDTLEGMRREVDTLGKFAKEMRSAGFRDVVLLGMGGSSLAPEVFSHTFLPSGPGRFLVLDSTDPASVRGVERTVNLRETLFIAASKSGKTIETRSQMHYFLGRLEAAGITHPGRNFLAITDAGSELETFAAERKFRRIFLNAADIGGRYSALSYFGLVPAALWGVNVLAVMMGAQEASQVCGPTSPPEANLGLQLGALMGAAAQQKLEKLYLLATPTLVSLGYWIEQLVAESTGKEGKGIVPVAGEVAGSVELFADGVVVLLGLAGEDRGPIYEMIHPLNARGVPMVDIRLGRREQLGAEFFKWEVATAVAGAALQINPFDEPNVQESKDNTSRLLEQLAKEGQLPTGVPRLAERGIELHVEGLARNRIFTTRLDAALRTFFDDRQKGDYLALLAYVDRSAANARKLETMRLLLRDRLRMPVLLGYGPRFLHSIGQLYKGGPASGMFLEITAADAEDAAIPGAAYSFGQLKMAQALGDLQALVRRDKPVLRLHLAQGPAEGLAQLHGALQEATAPH